MIRVRFKYMTQVKVLVHHSQGWQRVWSGTDSAYPQLDSQKKKSDRYPSDYPPGTHLKNIRELFKTRGYPWIPVYPQIFYKFFNMKL